MILKRLLLCLLGLLCSRACLSAELDTAPAPASKPPEHEVSFAIKDGWVALLVEASGRPAPAATIALFDATGASFAEGETDEQGRGEFPLPTSATFTVEVKVGTKPADPVRVSKVGERLEPARVLLSYGLRPCCRPLGRQEAVQLALAEPAPNSKVWELAGASCLCLGCLSCLVGLAWRKMHASQAHP